MALQPSLVEALGTRLESLKLSARAADTVPDTAVPLKKIQEVLGAPQSAAVASAYICNHDGGVEALCSLLRPELAGDETAQARALAAKILRALCENAATENDSVLGNALIRAAAPAALLGVVRLEGDLSSSPGKPPSAMYEDVMRALSRLAELGAQLNVLLSDQRLLAQLIDGRDAPPAAVLDAAFILERTATPELAAIAAEGLVRNNKNMFL